MDGAGRAAGIGAGREALAALALRVVSDRQVAFDEKDLLPIVMHKRLRREHPRRKAQKPSTAAAPVLFVEHAGQDFLFDAGGIAGWGRPTGIHLDAMEFEVGLADGHRFTSPHWRRLRPILPRLRRNKKRVRGRGTEAGRESAALGGAPQSRGKYPPPRY